MQLPDLKYVDTLIEDIRIYLDKDYSIHNDYNCHRFKLDRKGFIDIVKIIPYMSIERIYTCPYYHLFKSCHFQHLNVPIPIDYFTCYRGIVFFDNVTNLINHFSVQ